MRIIGIDPSLSRTGVCVLVEGGDWTLTSIVSGRKLGMAERQKAIADAVLEVARPGDVPVLEDFGISARYAATGRFVERIELVGMMKYLLPLKTGLPVLCAPPPLLKRFVAGKGSASKDEVLAAVRERWRVNAANDDEADAFALAALGRSALGDGQDAIAARFREYGGNSQALARIAFVQGRRK